MTLPAELAARNEAQATEILRLNRRVAELSEKYENETRVTGVLTEKLEEYQAHARKWRQVRTMIESNTDAGEKLVRALRNAGVNPDA